MRFTKSKVILSNVGTDFEVSENAWISQMGPTMIEADPGKSDIFDYHGGLYVEFSTGLGVFLIGMPYHQMRDTMTVPEIIEWHRTHVLTAFAASQEDTPNWDGIDHTGKPQTTPGSGGINPVAKAWPTDFGTVEFVATVPHAITAGFGYTLPFDEPTGNNNQYPWTGPELTGTFNPTNYRNFITNRLAILAEVPLDINRADYLQSLTTVVDDAERPEVMEKTAEAKEAALELLGRGEDAVTLALNMYMIADGENPPEVYVRRPEVATIDNQYNAIEDDYTVQVSNPAVMLDVIGHNFSIPMPPVYIFAQGSHEGVFLFGRTAVWENEDANSGERHNLVKTHFDDGAYGDIQLMADDFGIGKMAAILGPLSDGILYSAFGNEKDYEYGDYTFSEYYDEYQTLMIQGTNAVDIPSESAVAGQSISVAELKNFASGMGLQALDSTYRSTSCSAFVDPAVLSTTFALAMSEEGVDLDRLFRIYPQLGHLVVVDKELVAESPDPVEEEQPID